ncbi:MAG: uracil-DNA glycosylase family protein [bacterium]|nr:uracil-DNA glycosylase family protein [bacterium]
MSRIFINYRRVDSEGHVGRMLDHLLQHFDAKDIFMDIESIKPGQDFVETIENAVAGCDVFLIVIGPQWLTASDETGRRRLDLWDDFVRLEIAAALQREKRIIPVLVGRAALPSPDQLPEELRPFMRRQALELSHTRFALDMQKLIVAIREALPNRVSRKPHTDAVTFARKEAMLRELRLRLVNATDSPLYGFRVKSGGLPVLGEGSPDANILFIGESPGKNEAEQGVPFIGQSGEVLNEMLNAINLKRDDVFVTNLLLDRPPEKRDPLPEELAYYSAYVDQLIEIIQPGVIVALGRFAMAYLLKKLDLPEQGGKISELHGRLLRGKLPYGDIHLLPLYHPAVVLYSASQRDTLRKDFQKLKLFI